MADRTMWTGDTYPPAQFEISDETGILNLSSVDSVEIMFIGQNWQFSGPGDPVWPAQDDPDGTNSWNLAYSFASGDTANPDVYEIFAVVLWTPGASETFSTSDKLTVVALPVPA